MPHDKEGVKSEGNRNDYFLMDLCEDCRQPACLTRVEEQEDHVVLLNELFELVQI